MNSLQELNGFGQTSLTVNDDRASGVIFDRVAPLGPIDQVLDITSTTVTVDPGINIVEVINYSTANVRYRITIRTSGSPLLTGSTITWPSLPAGVVLSVVGSTYTLSGINTPAIWEQIKSFNWNLPVNYASCPNWSLDVAIVYYNDELSVDVSSDWIVYDPDNYYLAEFQSTSSLTCIGEDARLVSASMISTTVLFFEPQLLEGIIDTVAGVFSIECTPRLKPKDDLPAQFSLNCSVIVVKVFNANITANSSVNCNLTELITNLYNRNYIANNENLIFSLDAPFIGDGDSNTDATFTINLSCNSTSGYFSYSKVIPPTNNFSYSGTRSQVNNIFPLIRFYSYPGQTTNSSITYTQRKNGILQITQIITFVYNAGTYPGNTLELTVSSIGEGYRNIRFWNEDILYASNTDVLLVGAGAAGGSGENGAGGGGGGGEVIELFNFGTMSFIEYNVLIGRGGNRLVDYGTGFTNGENTVAFSQTARGGRGHPGGGAPGASGGGNAGGSGLEWLAYSEYVSFAGGGGGGHGSAGFNATLVSVNPAINDRYVNPGAGGNGYFSSITNQYYAAGGGGGVQEFRPYNLTRASIATGGSSIGGSGGKTYYTYVNGIGSEVNTLATSGIQNTGSGGGGGSSSATVSPARYGANGAHGVIVVKFKP